MNPENWPDNVILAFQEADYLFVNGDLLGAIAAVKRALDIIPNDGVLLNTYGNLLLKQGDLEGAAHEFKKSTILDPDLISGYINLTVTLILQNQLDSANEMIQIISAKDPDNPELKELLKKLAMINLEDNGERVDIFYAPDQVDFEKFDVYQKSHYRRYQFARSMIEPGSDVGDFACGTGYGSAMLAEVAGSVIGADICRQVVDYVKIRYEAIKNLEFVCSNLLDLGQNLARKLDTIVSFETLEHFPEGQLMSLLFKFNKLLKPGGNLIFSTPFLQESSTSALAAGFHKTFLIDEERLQNWLTIAGFHLQLVRFQNYETHDIEDILMKKDFIIGVAEKISEIPKVSICIPAYKQPESLRRALISVCKQDFLDFEVVITDDTQDESVKNMVDEFSSKIKIKYFKNSPCKSTPENWNEAIRRASGEYIKILHHDDWFLEEYSLSEMVSLLDNHHDSTFAFCACVNVDIQSGTKKVHAPAATQIEMLQADSTCLFFGNFVGAPSVTIYRRKPDLFYDFHLKWLVDVEFYIRLLKQNSSFQYLPKPLIGITCNSAEQVTRACENNKEVEISENLYVYDKIAQHTTVNEKFFLEYFRGLFEKYHIESIDDLSDCNISVPISDAVKNLLVYQNQDVNTSVIVFSKDRPMQLEAMLRSLTDHCKDIGKSRINILYAASSAFQQSLYNRIAALYPQFLFFAEKNFRSDLLNLIGKEAYVFFIVDDTIFIKDFYLKEIEDALLSHPKVIGFSLRLGNNTNYCYTLDKKQAIPSFERIGKRINKYPWISAEYDFAYPLEVSSSVYRSKDVKPILESAKYHNPNSLEAELFANVEKFIRDKPDLMCFSKSVAFSIPINKVQTTAWGNRSGDKQELTPDALARRYASGEKIDVRQLNGFTPNAAHQEVDLKFIQEYPSPLVSVVIPCYNQAVYLKEAVRSVLAQTYRRFEIIIIDDGSQDNTFELGMEIIHEHPHFAIRCLRQQNGGLSRARNKGIEISLGKTILPLDSDDMLSPIMLQKTTAVLSENPEVGIAYCDVEFFGTRNGGTNAIEWSPEVLPEQNGLNYCSLFRKQVWESVGGYNPNMVWGYEDWDFWVGCVEKGIVGKRIPLPLLKYRTKQESMYTSALKHDHELRARIISNHPKLYKPEKLDWARKLLSEIEAQRLTSKNAKDSPSAGSQIQDSDQAFEPAYPLPKIPPGKNPMVSVILPTFNRPKFLEQAVSSVLCQSYQDFEIIVVNDAGEDVEEIVNRLNQNGNIRYLKHDQNKGLAAARNTGIRASHGKYIAYLDDDDWFYPGHLETLVQALENKPFKVAYSDANRAWQEKINGSYVTIKKDTPYSCDIDFNDGQILVSNLTPVLCVMHARDCLESVGCFDESLKVLEDWDMWIRLSHRFQFKHIKTVTCEISWRLDGSSMSSNTGKKFVETSKKIYEKYLRFCIDKPTIINAQQNNLKANEDYYEMVANSERLLDLLLKQGTFSETLEKSPKIVNDQFIRFIYLELLKAKAKENETLVKKLEELINCLISKSFNADPFDPTETLQCLLNADDLTQALKKYEDRLDGNLLALVQTNSKLARAQNEMDVAEALDLLGEYISDLAAKRYAAGIKIIRQRIGLN